MKKRYFIAAMLLLGLVVALTYVLREKPRPAPKRQSPGIRMWSNSAPKPRETQISVSRQFGIRKSRK